MATEEDPETRDHPSKPSKMDHFTPEEREQIKRSQRRIMAGGLVFGILLAILGFFAAQNLTSNDDSQLPATPPAIEEITHVRT